VSIAPFTPASTGPHATHKSALSGTLGHHDGGADSDSALGFLAELAAAVSVVAPAQQLTVPGAPSGAAGDALGGTPQGTTGPLTTTLPAGLPTATGLGAGQIPGLPLAQSTALAATPVVEQAVDQLPDRPATPTGPVTGSALPTGLAATATPPAPLTPAAVPTSPVAAEPSTPQAALAPTPAGALVADAQDTLPAAMSPAAPAAHPTAAPDAAASSIAAAAVTNPLAAAAVSPSTPVSADPHPAETTAVLRQVFPEVTKAAASGPGSHRIAITLHPEDLGEVRVTVVVRGGNVRVDVATDPASGIARTALEHGAPELRKLIEATGADARVTFREFGSSTGSATDGGRQQSFAQAQAQADAQADARSGGSRAPHPASDRPDTATTVRTAGPSDPEASSVPSASPSAASGVDQLI